VIDRPEKLRVGVIGLGFMGRTHLTAYANQGADIVAVADARIKEILSGQSSGGNLSTGADEFPIRAGSFSPYTNPGQVFADPRVEAVSICTPTDTHVALASEALAAGKHVLLEKPVAISSDAVLSLVGKAKLHRKVVMPAMCMRFWPGWTWLRQTILGGHYGALRGITFQRLASPPSWNADFYKNAAKTGGALFDLHIHDADIVYWLFGMPRGVHSTGTIDHVTTMYEYDGGVRVTAEGGWDHAPGFPFRMRYTAVFEQATADFDIGREHPLMVTEDGQFKHVDLPGGTGYDGEIAHFLALVRASKDGKHLKPIATIDDALAVTRLLEAERASIESQTPVLL
jgi:predicted dehydrogenase